MKKPEIKRTLIALASALILGACTAPAAVNEQVFTTQAAIISATDKAMYTPAPTLTVLPTSESAPTSVTSLPDPGGYSWVPVIQGLDRPLEVVNAGDGSGRLFVVEQGGLIKVFQDGEILPESFLDIRDRVSRNGNERGLLGLAFHPDFKTSGLFFVDYTDLNGNTVIARFFADPALPVGSQAANASTEKIILQIHQPNANHNGGKLVFGPDGMLWIGMGDGGGQGDPQGNGQSLQTLLGKILRIDVNNGDPYSIPGDNPFATGGGLGEIWANGVRNPWGLFFDKPTGDLYIADVGQDAREEIDYVPAKDLPRTVNFGWNLMEGNQPYTGSAQNLPANYMAPVFEYDHGEGCSVTGGVVSRGYDLPEFYGVYLFGDFCSGTIWGMIPASSGAWMAQPLFNMPSKISSFGLDEEGEVYLVGLNGSFCQLKAK